MGRIIWAETIEDYVTIVSLSDEDDYVDYEIISLPERKDELIGKIKLIEGKSDNYESDAKLWKDLANLLISKKNKGLTQKR